MSLQNTIFPRLITIFISNIKFLLNTFILFFTSTGNSYTTSSKLAKIRPSLLLRLKKATMIAELYCGIRYLGLLLSTLLINCSFERYKATYLKSNCTSCSEANKYFMGFSHYYMYLKSQRTDGSFLNEEYICIIKPTKTVN